MYRLHFFFQSASLQIFCDTPPSSDMVKIALQLSAALENLTGLAPADDDFKWFFKFKCSSCGEVPDKWQHISRSEEHEVKGGRGTANAVIKCKLCGRENSVDVIADSIRKYGFADAGRFRQVAAFDCRGMEPVDFSPRDGWVVKGFKVSEDDEEEGSESGKVFDDVDLTEGEWADYDEVSDESVFISEIKHQFVKIK